MSNKRKYPASLFFTGLIMNIMGRFLILFLIAIVLIIVGFWVRWCAVAGFVVLCLDIILSLLLQLTIRNTVMTDSDDPEFRKFQDAISSDDWENKIKDLVESRMKEHQDDDDEDPDDDDTDE